MKFEEIVNNISTLWKNTHIRSDKVARVDWYVQRINRGRVQYQEVADIIGCPWWIIGIVHGIECSFKFDRHLHNGDVLTRRTTRVPAGRPAFGSGPYAWSVSAVDALQLKKWDQIDDWSIARCLYELERYNGFGYRMNHPDVNSPYIWACTNHYSSGKYVVDGRFDPKAVSRQAGAASIMLRMVETGLLGKASGGIRYSIAQGTDGKVYFLLVDSHGHYTFKEEIGDSLEQLSKKSMEILRALKEKYTNIEHVPCSGLVDTTNIVPWKPKVVSDTKTPTRIREYRRGQDVQLSKNFHLREFECKCGKCPTTLIDIHHVKDLQKLRDELGVPIRISSGCRCPSHNMNEGGVSDSQHLKGTATDIDVPGVKPSRVAAAAEKIGFNGIGRYKTFTHIDSRKEKARW